MEFILGLPYVLKRLTYGEALSMRLVSRRVKEVVDEVGIEKMVEIGKENLCLALCPMVKDCYILDLCDTLLKMPIVMNKICVQEFQDYSHWESRIFEVRTDSVLTGETIFLVPEGTEELIISPWIVRGFPMVGDMKFNKLTLGLGADERSIDVVEMDLTNINTKVLEFEEPCIETLLRIGDNVDEIVFECDYIGEPVYTCTGGRNVHKIRIEGVHHLSTRIREVTECFEELEELEVLTCIVSDNKQNVLDVLDGIKRVRLELGGRYADISIILPSTVELFSAYVWEMWPGGDNEAMDLIVTYTKMPEVFDIRIKDENIRVVERVVHE